LSGAVVVLIERFIPSRGVMPRESGASSNPGVIRGFDACTKASPVVTGSPAFAGDDKIEKLKS